MKATKKTITEILTAAVMLTVGSAWAGSLTPPGAPGATMHTLEDIYQELLATKQQVADIQQELDVIKLRQGASGMAETENGMALIPAGSFQMGDVFSEGSIDEQPVHTVTVSAFYMDQYEVTKALWDEVRAWADSEGLGYTDLPEGGGKGTSHPVHSISWYAAVQWANARSQRDGLTPVYYTTAAFTTLYKTGTGTPHANWSANGYRLPTEAEWEKAGRGGIEARRYPWADGNTISHTRANYFASPSNYDFDVNPSAGYHPDFSGGSVPHTSPVGSFLPNSYGLYDMAGNVAEWCWDCYESTYYGNSPGSDPHGPASGTNRVRRGGFWGNLDTHDCRVSYRSFITPGSQNNGLGFRLVRAAL